jgi:hypothetical protein
MLREATRISSLLSVWTLAVAAKTELACPYCVLQPRGRPYFYLLNSSIHRSQLTGALAATFLFQWLIPNLSLIPDESRIFVSLLDGLFYNDLMKNPSGSDFAL